MIGGLSNKLVAEISTTSGTGDYVLNKAISGSLKFRDKISDGTIISYSVTDGVRSENTRGIFIFPNILTRDLILSSTDLDNKINWPVSGQRIVQLTEDTNFEEVNIIPKEKDPDLNLIIPIGFTGNITFQDNSNRPIWRIKTTGDAFGCDLHVNRFGADGIAIDHPFVIKSDTGIINFEKGISSNFDSKIGFFAVDPVVQPDNSGNSSLTDSGSGSNILVDTTFTGGLGTTKYTVGQIVSALKKLGIIKS